MTDTETNEQRIMKLNLEQAIDRARVFEKIAQSQQVEIQELKRRLLNERT